MSETSGVDVLTELEPTDARWDAFATSTPGATTFHHPAWLGVIQQTYRYRAAALALTGAGGRLAAGLPVLRVRRFGRAMWVSLPFTDYCPPLAADEQSLRHLGAALGSWQRMRSTPLEVRGALPETAGGERPAVAVRHVLPLEADAGALQRRLPRAIVRHVRSAVRAGLRARVTSSPDDLPAFYRLQLLTRRRLGAPVQPRRFLERLWRRVLGCGLGFAVLAETADGEPVGAGVFLVAGRTMILKYSASEPRHWHLKPNHLVLWTAMEWGCDHGRLEMDLGRSELAHASLRRFKSAWGAEEVPLVHTVLGAAGGELAGQGRWRSMLTPVIRGSPPVVCRVAGELLYRYAG